MKKLKRFLTLAFAATTLSAAASSAAVTASYAVVPLPQEITPAPGGGEFILNEKTVISYPAGDAVLKKDAEHLRGYINTLTGHNLKISDKSTGKNEIVLRANLSNPNPDGYVLTVGPKTIDINGASPAGTFYGIQTLRKSIPQAVKGDVAFPAVTVTDQPRFAYRGAHFDVCRHFFPADSVKTFIDMLALHNINRFHWHISDDQGWRVEIKSRPRLTEVGSKRPGTIIGHSADQYDNIPVEGFYTQDEIRDIIQYAADRHIVIIPEIDMPGHMVCALTAYPELGCTGGPYEVWRRWGVAEDVLCPGNDETYKFLDEVFGEIADLFPSEYVHVGGDECPKVRWEVCEKCQARIAELGFVSDEHGTKEEKLQSHVVQHVSDFLAGKGKKIIGWDEILEGGLAPGAVVMSWRGEEGGIAAAKLGHDVIMSPNTYFYFDYYQTLDQENEPIAIGGYIPLEKAYSYEPITDVYTPEEAAHIIGVQANLWTEYIKTFNQAQYMELPRMAALSDVQWSTAPKDYNAFLQRVQQMMNHYKANGYRFSTRAFDIESDIDVDADKNAVVVTLSTADDAPIFYTVDGSEPDANSATYTGPVAVSGDCTLKAVANRPFGLGRVYTENFDFNKATARPVTLESRPSPKYSLSGPQALVDGKTGRAGYSSGGWMGFCGDDAVVVVDLGGSQNISNVSTNTCVNTGAWVFDARSAKVEVSDDGKQWRTVATADYPAAEAGANGIFNHRLDFSPVDARFVRFTVGSEREIPQWHTGNGKPGFLFIDEVMVN